MNSSRDHRKKRRGRRGGRTQRTDAEHQNQKSEGVGGVRTAAVTIERIRGGEGGVREEGANGGRAPSVQNQ